MNSSALILEEKRVIRERLRPRLKEIPSHERRDLSREAAVRLLRQEQFQKAEFILGYLPLPDEVDLFGAFEWAWAAGKTVTLPRYVPESQNYCAALANRSIRAATTGAFGVVEPSPDSPAIPLNRLDFVLVPGLAFDRSGMRLGRGKGFYDRLLAEVNIGTCIKCGVALDVQLVDSLPADTHDIAMNFILTPTRWLSPTAEK
jgi:5-formyltetrahydrofolate cyclo-ligase